VSWEQAHVFEARDGGTVVRERMEYRVPLGAPVDGMIVRPLLVAIQAHRARGLATSFDRDVTRARVPAPRARAGGA